MKKEIDLALDKLYSYVDYSMTHQGDVPADALTLERITRLMERLGNPQNTYPVIHVAGTKGKGSVCAMLASALEKAGLKVGLYTSPHLIETNERIRVDGKMISDSELIRLINTLSADVDAHEHVSTFELMTAIAFQYFAEQKVDIAVVEVGLGGRLDATNIVTPILSVITSISVDHTAFLGHTIPEIASEKAGILKKGVPVISGVKDPAAKDVIRETAEALGCPWVDVNERFRYLGKNFTDHSQEIVLWKVEDNSLMQRWLESPEGSIWKPVSFEIPFAGSHQLENGALVYTVLTKVLSRMSGLSMEMMLTGVRETFWPCRFEKISESPIIYSDGAHNQDSAKKLARLAERFCGNMKIKCVLGMSEDKQMAEIIHELAGCVEEFVTTKSTHPRAADPLKLARLVRLEGRPCRVTDSIEAAAALMEADATPNTAWIVTGSLFAAAGIRSYYAEKNDLGYFGKNGA